MFQLAKPYRVTVIVGKGIPSNVRLMTGSGNYQKIDYSHTGEPIQLDIMTMKKEIGGLFSWSG